MRPLQGPPCGALLGDSSAAAHLFLALAALGSRNKVVFDKTKADGQFKKTACNDKLAGMRPDFRFTPMEVGLKQAVDWFAANYASARKGGN